jgi:arylsulfatase A-like enzyme
MERPNILYLHTHDCGRYVQPYGHPVPTPALQRLAGEGVLFRNAHCAGPTCSPSRAALLTGESPHSCGMLGLGHVGWRLNDYSHHIIHTLGAAGYASALCGTQHLGRVEDIGYDEIVPWEGDEIEGKPAAVRKWLARRPEGPFFLSVGFNVTHRVFDKVPCTVDARFTAPPPTLPDNAVTRGDMAAYWSCAKELDRGMGGVLAALEEAGLADSTIVVCTTDHGIAFPGMKCTLTDHGTGVMLIVRGPGFEPGTETDALISQIDVFPTLCEQVGIEAPGWLEGRSFLPVLRGERREVNEEIFSEVTVHAAVEPMRSVRTARWRYVRRWANKGTPVLANCDDSPSKTFRIEHGWAERPVPDEALYDLVFDPNEASNLAGCPGHGGVLEEMRGRLGAWMHRTEDPLLGERLPPCEGAEVVEDTAVSVADGWVPYDPGKLRPLR